MNPGKKWVTYFVQESTSMLKACTYLGAYAGFLRGGVPNFKISGILDIHDAKRHVVSNEAANLC